MQVSLCYRQLQEKTTWHYLSLTGWLLQILALLAMEQPVTLSADDIRDEKVRVSTSLLCSPAVGPAAGSVQGGPGTGEWLASIRSTVLTACLMLLCAMEGVCTGLHTL